jgi:ribosomal silencing factor RsfS
MEMPLCVFFLLLMISLLLVECESFSHHQPRIISFGNGLVMRPRANRRLQSIISNYLLPESKNVDKNPIEFNPVVDVVLMSGIERKAKSFTLVKLKDESTVADYHVILEGSSKPHINAIADFVEVSLRKILPHYEPRKQFDIPGGWCALDYG